MTNENNTPSNETVIEIDEKNIPFIHRADGTLQREAQKSMFLKNENIAKEDRLEAKKRFYEFQIEFKKERIREFESKIDGFEEEINNYNMKIEDLGRELTPAEKIKRKAEQAKKAYEKAMADLAELEG